MHPNWIKAQSARPFGCGETKRSRRFYKDLLRVTPRHLVGTAGSSDPRLLACSCTIPGLRAHCISPEGKCFHYAQKQHLASVMCLFLERHHTAESVSCSTLPVTSAVNHGVSDILAMGLLWSLHQFLSAYLCLQKQASSKHGRSSPRLELPHELGTR